MKKVAEVKSKRPNGKKKRVYATGRVKKVKVPVNAKVRGQDHHLAYINDEEREQLEAGRGILSWVKTPGPKGVPALPPGATDGFGGRGVADTDAGGGGRGSTGSAGGMSGGGANSGGQGGGGSSANGQGGDRGGSDRGGSNAGQAGGYGGGGRDGGRGYGGGDGGGNDPGSRGGTDGYGGRDTGAGVSNASSKGGLEGLGNRSSKSDMGVGNRSSLEGMGNKDNKSDIGFGIRSAPEAPMDSIANAAARAASLTSSSLLGNSLSVDPISGMGMKSMAMNSPFGNMSPMGSTSLDVNARNAENAIAGIVGGQTAAPAGFSKNQDATIASLVGGMPSRVGQVGMPGLQASNLANKTDLQQSIHARDPFSPSSTHAMNNPPTRDPVAPSTSMKTRGIAPISRSFNANMRANMLNNDIIGAMTGLNAPPSISVTPASAPGFPGAPDPNADMNVEAPAMTADQLGALNNSNMPSGNYSTNTDGMVDATDMARSVLAGNTPSIGDLLGLLGGGRAPGGRSPEDRGGNDDRTRYASTQDGGSVSVNPPSSPPGLIGYNGNPPANLSPYHKSLWEYIYNA